jgi:hypothetical protein
MNVIALSGVAFVVNLIGVFIRWQKNEGNNEVRKLQKRIL